MSFLLSQPGKSACHFMFDCSSKSGGFLCTTPACCQHATYIVVAGCQRNEIPHLELTTARAATSVKVLKKIWMCKMHFWYKKGYVKHKRGVRWCAHATDLKLWQKTKQCNSEAVGVLSWSPMNISVIRSAGVSTPTIWGYIHVQRSYCVRQFHETAENPIKSKQHQ